jgi:uncharacterized membrane protein YhaH (DUF805 family)
MNFDQAITAGFQNYVNFSGRAIRSEFWYWFLFVVLVVIASSVIDAVLFSELELSPISTLAGLALILPGIAISIRRLHDLDRSGWWYLLVFVPLVGGIILLIWNCMRGTVGPNRFGPDPLGGTP